MIPKLWGRPDANSCATDRAPAGLIGIHAWELTGNQLNKIAQVSMRLVPDMLCTNEYYR